VEARAHAVIAALLLAVCGCASSSSISPDRQDFVVVEGRVARGSWNCGTVTRPDGGYFYVCDMPLAVERVVFGRSNERALTARYFVGESDTEDDVYTGPHLTRDRRAAAILWKRDGEARSFMLMRFPGRWCVPNWMADELSLSADEVMQLERSGFPQCTAPTE